MKRQNILIIVGVITLFIFIIITLTFLNSDNIFRSNFTIKIKGDFTSSGASRRYDANIVFHDNKAISGTQSYYVGEGGGCQSNCEHLTTCKVKNQEWVDSITEGECTLGRNGYLSKESIEILIKEKELKPARACGHLDTCFEISS